jgi:hypothetical protein
MFSGQKPNDQVRSLYRADLHDELKRLALLQSGDWKTPTLTLGVEVVSVVRSTPPPYKQRFSNTYQDIHNAKVHLKDGTSLSADVLIGADGERVCLISFLDFLLKPSNNLLNHIVSRPFRIHKNRPPVPRPNPHPPCHDTNRTTARRFRNTSPLRNNQEKLLNIRDA